MKKIILVLFCLVGIFNLTAQTTITIGTSSSVSSGTESSPINVFYRSHHCQILYTPAEINNAGWLTAGIISKIGFNIFGTPSEALPNFSIKLKNTTSASTNVYDPTGLSIVYSSAAYLPTAGGFELLTLDNNFTWDGTSNILMDVCFDQISAYTSTGQVYMYPYTNTGADYAYERADNNPVCSSPTNSSNGGYNYVNKPQVQFEITALPPCSGLPTAGDAVSTSTNICANNPFSLNVINNSTGSGLEYQWQSSPNGTVWTNLGSVQLTPLMNISSLPATTYYQCVTTCTVSASSSTSTPVMVALNPMINCYCTVNLANNNTVDCTQDKIVDFSIANVISQTTNCDAFGYSDSTASNYTSINLTGGLNYTLSVNTLLSGFNQDGIVGAWIDYNQNTIFDSNEFIPVGLTTGITNGGFASNSFNVPITVNTGTVRMRIVLDAYYANASTVLNPCTNNPGALGQVLDYKVNLTAAPACSAAPNAGNATSTQSAVCQNVSYNLDLVGNDAVSGLTYQWQSSPNGTVWTNLGVAQNSIPYSVASQSTTTHYRCITTCTASSMTGTSTAIVVNQNAPVNCLCAPESISCTYSQISNVTFESINHSPSCGSGGYTDYMGLTTVSLTANQTYSISIDLNCQGGSGYAGLWIDFNNNGIFEASEYSYVGSTAVGTLTTNIFIPYSSTGGLTAMRIKMESTFGTFIGLDPCFSNQYDGHTLDYLLDITPATPCSGAPNAGDANSTAATICENAPFTLGLINNDIVSNISYQWQSSPDNIIWTNLGAPQMIVPYIVTSQSVTMNYRCITTCTSSALSGTSTPVVVAQNPVTSCYCIPAFTECSGNEKITYVALAAMTNTSLCDGVDGYSDYTGTVSSATVNAGQSYTLTTGLGYMYSQHVYTWIDYNQNGSFEPSEYTNLGSNSGIDTITGTINIPVTALTGNTRMRVRNFSGIILSPNDACISPVGGAKFANSALQTLGSGPYGETEDYMITILPPDCGSVNFPPTIPISGVSNICAGQTSSLDISSSIPVASGITYQWLEDTGSGFVGTGTNSPSLNASPSVNTSYYCEISCNASVIRITDTVQVKINTISTTPVTTSATCNGLCDGSATINASSFGATLSYSWSPSVGTADMAVALCAGIYTVDITNPTGCSVTETLTIIEPTPIVISSPVQTNVSCFGLADGTAGVSVSGGISPLTFSWSPTGGNALTATNLSAGNYTFMIFDGNGCNKTSPFTITEPSPLTVSVTNIQGSCVGGSSGQAEMIVSGGTPSYSYNWTSGGANQLEINLPIGTQTCTVTDANSCTITETVSINASAPNFTATISGVSTICEQLVDSITSNIVGGSGSFSYSWMEMPTNATSVNPNFTYTASIGTFSYNLTVTDNVSNCIVNSNSVSVSVNPSSNFSGTVTTSGAAPVAGRVVLFKYLPFYTKFDSVAGQNIGAAGDFLFTSFTSGTYIIKAIPTSTTMQIAYGANPGDTAVAWKDAKQINHGCAVNDIQNIFVPPLTVLTPDTTGISGVLSGGVYGGPSYGQRFGDFGAKPTIPGTPIGGIIVKGGKNPGGQMFVQTVTDSTGKYSLAGLPPNTGNESYFILVDIPGLDTNGTYHRVINFTNNNFQGLDFVVDSAKINPIPENVVSVHDISAIENEIKVFPNPASNNVNIQYNLKANSLVKIELFDMLGKSVKVLLPETEQSMEIYKNSWQINDVRSGLYFIKMTINGIESTIKLSVIN